MFSLFSLGPEYNVFWGKTKKAFSTYQTTSVYHVILWLTHFFLILCLVPRCYFLLVFSYSAEPFWPLLFTLILLSPSVGVAKNFILCLLSIYISFQMRWTHLIFCIQLLSNNSQISILAQTSYLRSRHLHSTDCWTCHSSFLIAFSASGLSDFQFVLHASDSD